MAIKLITALAIIFVIAGCRNRDIRKSHTLTDFSKPITLTFKLSGSQGSAGFRMKGRMNGTLGYSETLFFKGFKFPGYKTANNLYKMDKDDVYKYVKVQSDSVKAETNLSIGQGGLTYGLYFIPGTATQGKIEVEFWEHPTGFY